LKNFKKERYKIGSLKGDEVYDFGVFRGDIENRGILSFFYIVLLNYKYK